MTGTSLNLYMQKPAKEALMRERDRLGFSLSNIGGRLFAVWLAAGCPLDFEIVSQYQPAHDHTDNPQEDQR